MKLAVLITALIGITTAAAPGSVSSTAEVEARQHNDDQPGELLSCLGIKRMN